MANTFGRLLCKIGLHKWVWMHSMPIGVMRDGHLWWKITSWYHCNRPTCPETVWRKGNVEYIPHP